MPIYEFECEKCKAVESALMKVSDPMPEKCPQCGGKLEKKMSLSGFALKGTGWYSTDYKKQNGNKET